MLTLSIFLSVLAQTPIDDPNRFNQYLPLAYAVMWPSPWPTCSTSHKQRNLRQEIRLMRLLEEMKRGGPNRLPYLALTLPGINRPICRAWLHDGEE